ncbi:hypothetical protein SAMN04515617_114160, partial [Collimonas sp. OK242]
HQFHIALHFPFKTPARLNAIEVTVNVDFKEYRGVIRRPSGFCGIDTIKSHFIQIQFVNEDVDHPYRVALCNVVVQLLWKQYALCPVPAFDEAPHIDHPKYDEISLGHGKAYFVYSKNKKVTLYLKPDPDWIRFYTVWAMSEHSVVEQDFP